MTSGRARLAELLAGLGEPGPLQVGPPDGDGWWSLDEARRAVEAWFPALVARAGDHRVGAAHLTTWVARVPALLVGLPAVLAGVVPVTTSERLWVHRHAEGWFDRHAIDPDRLLEGEVEDVTVVAGERLASLTAPLVDHLVDVLPVGAPMVWGSVADSLAAHALLLARAAGRDQRETWRRCDAILDALEMRVPELRQRPTALPVAWSGGTTLYAAAAAAKHRRPRRRTTPATGATSATESDFVKHLGASLSALLLVGAIATPAVAGHDRNPSPRVATYAYDLAEVAENAPGDVDGTVRLQGLPNGKVIVTIEASGLAPNLPHAQHIHVPGGEDGSEFVRGACPTIADDGDGDGLVDTLEGVPAYGGVKQSLTTSGDTSPGSALAVDRFPVADAEGNLEYERTFTPTDDRVHTQLGDVEVVVHGIDLDGSGAYDGEAESSLTRANPDVFVPLEATIPVLCGGVNG